MTIAFIDLAAQQNVGSRNRIDAAIQKVLAHGAYVMGPEVREFEVKLAEFGQAKRALSCANGTDAIALPADGLGDRARRPRCFAHPFTFAATAEVIPWTERSRCLWISCPILTTLILPSWKPPSTLSKPRAG